VWTVTLLGASPNNAAPLAASPLVPGAYCLSDLEYSAAAFTPNFPSYPSGHTTFGGACFNSLLLFRSQRGITNPNTVNVTVTSAELDGRTTDNYDPSLTRPDSPMTFTSVVEANPAQIDLGALTGSIDASRVLLGVHWSFDEMDGDTAGRRVGDIVHSRAYAVTWALEGCTDSQPGTRHSLLARIIHEKCAIKAKPLLSLTTMRMGCLMKFFAMKSLAQVFWWPGPISSGPMNYSG